jgi:trehalose-6-phosphate synthase
VHQRLAALLENVVTENLAWWRQSFLDELDSVPPSSGHGHGDEGERSF